MPRIPSRAHFTRKSAGFTLIELMITIAIGAILARLAIPSYMDYVRRGKIVDATAGLAARQVKMEQYFQDNLKYASTASACTDGNASKYFTFSCASDPAVTDTTYMLVATGTGSMTGFKYTINQAGVKTSAITNVTNWTASSTTCWIVNVGGAC
jgi:type IV pilus assembly protein PilE